MAKAKAAERTVKDRHEHAERRRTQREADLQRQPALALAGRDVRRPSHRRTGLRPLLGAGAALSPEHRRCVRRGQRGADHPAAQLARTVRDVRNLFATTAQLAAAVQQRQTELTAAQSDLARRQRLGASGAVSGEELQHAFDAVKSAQAALLAAQQQLAANRARVDGTTLKDHPQVRDAAAAVRNAYLTYARTELPAPVSGFVARRNVQLGQRVSPGTALMAVVPPDPGWGGG